VCIGVLQLAVGFGVILGDARVPLRCIGVVREAPAMCAQCLAASTEHAIAPDARHGAIVKCCG
jgi:hypothetical protein